MSVSIAPQYTQRDHKWTQWKSIYNTHGFIYQFEETSELYTIWGYNGPEVHITTIWKGDVPYTIVADGYSQSQNDSDKSDFETNYKVNGNKSLSVTNIFGASDNTKIGNTGDKLKVDVGSSNGSLGGPLAITSKLRYVDMNDSNGGVARETSVTNSADKTIFSYTGSGLLFWFIVNIENKDGWLFKFKVDGQDIFPSSGLVSNDLESSSVYDLDDSNDEDTDLLGLHFGNNDKLVWSGSLGNPVKFNSSIQIILRRQSGKSSKKFKAGLVCLTKET